MDEQLIGFVAVVGVFTFLSIGSVATAWTVRSIARLRAETQRLALERGLPLPVEDAETIGLRDLRRGVQLIALGIGVAIALGVLAEPAIAALGAVPAALGGGFLASAWLARRRSGGGSSGMGPPHTIERPSVIEPVRG